MKRIILHWTAGGHKANATDRKHYHFIIEGDGTVVEGNHPPEANNPIANPRDSSSYAAHTRGMNSASIGVSLAAMRSAKDRPFNPGSAPVTEAQVRALPVLVAKLCQTYDIPVRPDTVLTHAEVEITLGVKQAGKWDIRWLPGMTEVGDAVTIGNVIRERVAAALQPVVSQPLASKPVVVSETPKLERQSPPVSLINRIFSFLNKGGPA
jgi:hypothetical protein